MGKLTGTRHGDAANELLWFYTDKFRQLEESGQYFMAAVALALALETAVPTCLLVECGEDSGGELKIPVVVLSLNSTFEIPRSHPLDPLKAWHMALDV
jgi:hypothetical protein